MANGSPSDRLRPEKGILILCDTCNKVIMPPSTPLPSGEGVFRCSDCAVSNPVIESAQPPQTVPVGYRQSKSGYGIKPSSRMRISKSSIPVVKPSSGRQPAYATPPAPRHEATPQARSKFFWAAIGAAGVVLLAVTIGVLTRSKAPVSEPATDTRVAKPRENLPPDTSLSTPPETAKTPVPKSDGEEQATKPTPPPPTVETKKPANETPVPLPPVAKVDEKKVPVLTADQFKKKLDECTALSHDRKFGAAQAAFAQLKAQAETTPWWSDKSADFSKAEHQCKDAFQNLKDEAREALDESRSANNTENLDRLAKTWQTLANISDPETSKLGQEVLTQVAADRSRIGSKLAAVASENLKKDVEAQLAEVENAMKQRAQVSALKLLQPKLEDLEKSLRTNAVLANLHAERYATLRFDVNQLINPKAGSSRAQQKRNGPALELTYDFATDDQIKDFTMDGGTGKSKVSYDTAKQAANLRTEGTANWGGAKHNNGVWRLPFNFLKDNWVAEVEVQLTEDSATEKNAAPGLAVWDGTATNYVRMSYHDDRKNYSLNAVGPVNPSKTSENQWKETQAFPSTGTPEKVKLQMICSGGNLTLNIATPSRATTLKSTTLTFVPKYIGVYLNTYNGSATACFDNLKLMAVPDPEILKLQLETERSSYISRMTNEIKKEAAISTVDNAKGVTTPLNGEAANDPRAWPSLWTLSGKSTKAGFQDVSGTLVYKYVPDKGADVSFKRTVNLDANKKYMLKLNVSASGGKSLDLAVSCNGKELKKTTLKNQVFTPIDVDLSEFSGQKAELDLKVKSSDGSSCLWASVNIVSQ